MDKRIVALAATFGNHGRLDALYADSSEFRGLCSDLEEVMQHIEALPRTPENTLAAAEYGRLMADLIDELRDYMAKGDIKGARPPKAG
jgi:hypothetical protein